MIRGLYTSGWSMLANEKQMDIISNNLANVSTNAYKQDTVVLESFPSVLTKRINDTRSALNPSGNVGDMQLGSDVGEVYTYFNQGGILKTGNNLDFAIKDSKSAFFTVQVTDGNGQKAEYYTRDGAFIINNNGQLSTVDGNLVMGKNGPIVLQNANFSVESDGTIVQNGQAVDKLLITEFTDTRQLRKFGSNLISALDGAGPRQFTGTVQQGYLEQSNVNVVKEMVSMISVMRAYEANQKVLQAQDGTLEKAVNEIGAVR